MIKIKKSAAIGITAAAAALTIGGAVMTFVGGLPTVKTVNDEGKLTNKGIGMLNFDKTSLEAMAMLFVMIGINDAVETHAKWLEVSDSIVKNGINMMGTNLPFKDYLSAAKKSWDESKGKPEELGNEVAYSVLSSMESASSLQAVTITGLVFLPIGLILLAGGIILTLKASKKTETKAE